MDQPGMAEDDGAGDAEKGDAIDAYGDKRNAVARRGCGDHGQLKAAVKQAGMEMELVRGRNQWLWKTDLPQSFTVFPPHGLDGAKHGPVEETASCRGGIGPGKHSSGTSHLRSKQASYNFSAPHSITTSA